MGLDIVSIFNPPKVKGFDYENIERDIMQWKTDIEEMLKVNKYDMNNLCVNEVLGTVICLMQDNTIYE
jgi:hypothetical protein